MDLRVLSSTLAGCLNALASMLTVFEIDGCILTSSCAESLDLAGDVANE